MDNKELQGVLFPNKKTNDKQPDYKGSVKIGGVDYYLAAWQRTSKANKPYLSVLAKHADTKYTASKVVKEVAKAVGGKEELQSPTIYEEVPF